MQKLFIILFFSLLISSELDAQLQWTIPPENLDLECDQSTNNTTIESYLEGLEATASGCSNFALITWDYTDPGEFDCYESFLIEITAEDDCGMEPDLIVSIYVEIEDTEEPTGASPIGLALQCGDPNNETIIQAWIADFENSIFEDNCTALVDLVYENSYDGFVPDCGEDDYIEFYVYDECGNDWYDFVEITVEELGEVTFSPFNTSVLESDPTIDVCLSISNANIHNTVATVQLQGSSTATNGVDYNTLPVSQTITFPANSTADVCFDLTVVDDTDVEPSEYINFEIISAVSNGVDALSFPRTRTLTITDNDDNDSDGIGNLIDNCPDTANNNQSDIDNDGIGDVCDNSIVVNTLIETKENIYVDKNNGGVILTSNSGLCFLLIADDDGVLSTVPVECP